MQREIVSLITPETSIKVSSTLNKSVGKKNLVDGSLETCWTSQQGLPQTITLTFPSSSPVIPKSLSLTFQGGFVGRTCAVHVRLANNAISGFTEPESTPSSTRTNEWKLLTYIYPEDVNRKQTYALPDLASTNSSEGTEVAGQVSGSIRSGQEGIAALKLTFETSSDFFGRVTVYDLRLEGYRV